MRLFRSIRGNPDPYLNRNLSVALQVRLTDRDGRLSDGFWEVGPAHSTPSTGKPCTWGRGRQGYVVHKGNFNQTVELGSEANLTVGDSDWPVVILPGCEASNLEEPGAVVPHAGICAGAAG
jgi:hypothetical protein